MKKLALLLFAMLMATPFFAQGHLDFCGVPIDGHIDNFVAEMERLGYTETYRNEGGVAMTGKFAGKDARLAIFCTSKAQTTHLVWATFEGETNWKNLKKLYLELKAACIKKYEGYKVETQEQFDAPYREGNGNEMKAVREGKCLYSTTLTGDKGKITLFVDFEGSVMLTYEDLKNTTLDETER